MNPLKCLLSPIGILRWTVLGVGMIPFWCAAAPSDAGIRMERLPSGVRYGLIGNPPAGPAPTLFVFQGDIDTAQKELIYTEVARLMGPAGFLSVLIDAPAHGDDRRQNEPAELLGWRYRVERGEDLVGDFVGRCQAVLDHLVKAGMSDPERVAAVGTSRGGFLAFHLAAADPRVRCVGGMAPVTDLLMLREFNGLPDLSAANRFALVRLSARLQNRPVWLSIGNRDERVGTEATIAFSRALIASATPTPGSNVPVTLLVHDGEGHRSTATDHQRLAQWLLAQPLLQKNR